MARGRAAPAPAARPRAAIPAERAGPEREVLAGRERAFERVGVAEVMRLLAERTLGVAAFERERRPHANGRKPAIARKRLDLPAPLGPVDEQRLAASTSNARSREQLPSAPLESADFPRSSASSSPQRRLTIRRCPTKVCVAAHDGFIYKPASPLPRPIPGDAAWPASTVSNAARSSPSEPRPMSTFRSRPRRRTGSTGVSKLPFSMKIVLENLLRNEDGRTVKKEDIEAVVAWLDNRGKTEHEIAFRPARVLMQDFTGVPAVVDLAAMRDAMVKLGGDPNKINPLVPVDLVIDHSVVVDYFGTAKSLGAERQARIRAEPGALPVPQVGPAGVLQFLRRAAGHRHLPSGQPRISRPDGVDREGEGRTARRSRSPIPTRSSAPTATPRWSTASPCSAGASAASRRRRRCSASRSRCCCRRSIGFKLTGELREGVTATDLVLTVTQMLRKKGVVGKFVEFYGPGLNAMSVADRATLANMAPEYGATCGLFPIDAQTLAYLKTSGRKTARIELVEKYAKAQGMFRTRLTPDPVFTDTLELDLGEVAPSLAGPKRPQDRVPLADAKAGFVRRDGRASSSRPTRCAERHKVEGTNYDLGHGDVVIAAITSCTNTSNPSVMIAAGLVARNAVAKGLTVKPWVKTSLAPGSQVVADYLEAAELQKPLDKLGFNIVGYGCTTCIGNSGPLAPEISATIAQAQSGRRRGALGQPQLRGPRQSRRARQLSRLAAARRRLCARGLDADRSRPRTRSAPTSRASRSISPTSGRRPGGHRPRRGRRSRRRCSRRSTPACSTATPTGGRSRRRRARPMPGTWARPTCRTRPTSRAWR